MVEVTWTEQSLLDIDNIAEFIAKDSHKYAQIQVQRFFKQVEILESHPKAGRVVPEL
jgi:plasmid stabilization system protein ParE